MKNIKIEIPASKALNLATFIVAFDVHNKFSDVSELIQLNLASELTLDEINEVIIEAKSFLPDNGMMTEAEKLNFP